MDLFCGIGGFSEGARRASAGKWRTRVAIDICPKSLNIHRAQHPRCHHRCMELGTPASAAYVLSKIKTLRRLGYTKLHLHGSPPCTHFSGAAHVNIKKSPPEDGMRLINWFIRLAESCKHVTSWTMENVMQCGEHLPASDFSRLILKSTDYGGYSNRRRLFIGNFDPRRVVGGKKAGLPVRGCLLEVPSGDSVKLCNESWRDPVHNQGCPLGRISSIDAPAPSFTRSGRLSLVSQSSGQYTRVRRIVKREYMNMHNIANYRERKVTKLMIANMVMPECAQAIMNTL